MAWNFPCCYLTGQTLSTQKTRDFVAKIRNSSDVFGNILNIRSLLNGIGNDPVDMVGRSFSRVLSSFRSKSTEFQSKSSKLTLSADVSTLFSTIFKPFIDHISLLLSKIGTRPSDYEIFNTFVIDIKSFFNVLSAALQATAQNRQFFINHLNLLLPRLRIIFAPIQSACSQPLAIQSNVIDQIQGCYLPLLGQNGLYQSFLIDSVESKLPVLASQTMPRILNISTSAGKVSLLVKPADPSAEITTSRILTVLDCLLAYSEQSKLHTPKLISFSDQDSESCAVGSFLLPGSSLTKLVEPFMSPFNQIKQVKSKTKSSFDRWKVMSWIYSPCQFKTQSLFWSLSPDWLTSSITSWLIGLGDRHLGNFLLSNVSQSPSISDKVIVTLDFGQVLDCSRFLPVPEQVPFRLSPLILRSLPPWNRGSYLSSHLASSLQSLAKFDSLIANCMSSFKTNPPLLALKKINQLRGSQSICQSDLTGFSELYNSLLVTVKCVSDTRHQIKEFTRSQSKQLKVLQDFKDVASKSDQSLQSTLSHLNKLRDDLQSLIQSIPINDTTLSTINSLQSQGLSALSTLCPLISSNVQLSVPKGLPPGLFGNPQELIKNVRKLISEYQTILKNFDGRYGDFSSVKVLQQFLSNFDVFKQAIEKGDTNFVVLESSKFLNFIACQPEDDELRQLQLFFNIYSEIRQFQSTINQLSNLNKLPATIQSIFSTFALGFTKLDEPSANTMFNDFFQFVSSNLSVSEDFNFDHILNFVLAVEFLILIVEFVFDLKNDNGSKATVRLYSGFSTFVLNYLICGHFVTLHPTLEIFKSKFNSVLNIHLFDKEMSYIYSDLKYFDFSCHDQSLIDCFGLVMDKFLTRFKDLVSSPKTTASKFLNFSALLNNRIAAIKKKYSLLCENFIKESELSSVFIKYAWFWDRFYVEDILSHHTSLQSLTPQYFITNFNSSLKNLEKSMTNPLLDSNTKNSVSVAISTVRIILQFESFRNFQGKVPLCDSIREFIQRLSKHGENQLEMIQYSSQEEVLLRINKNLEDLTGVLTTQSRSLASSTDSFARQFDNVLVLQEIIENESEIFEKFQNIVSIMSSIKIDSIDDCFGQLGQVLSCWPDLDSLIEAFSALVLSLSSALSTLSESKVDQDLVSQNVKDFIRGDISAFVERKSYALTQIKNSLLKLRGLITELHHLDVPLVESLDMEEVATRLVANASSIDVLSQMYIGWMPFC
ncbi:hypothetical protein GEMRC1_005990 [Eukaryota sp. GEM-RC1]